MVVLPSNNQEILEGQDSWMQATRIALWAMLQLAHTSNKHHSIQRNNHSHHTYVHTLKTYMHIETLHPVVIAH